MNTGVGVNLSQFFAAFFAQASIFLTLIMVIGMTLGALSIQVLLGTEGLSQFFEEDGKGRLILAGVVILVVLAMFASNLVTIPGLPGFSLPGLSGNDIAVILLIAATVGIIFWVSSGASPSPPPASGGQTGG
jgi:hypothetical protein